MTVLLKICYALAFIVFETAYIVIFGFDTNELFTDFAQIFCKLFTDFAQIFAKYKYRRWTLLEKVNNQRFTSFI